MKGRKKKLIISLIAILVCLGMAVLAGSFVFRINEVVFIGNGNVPSEELLHRSGILVGETNIFMLDRAAATLEIESYGDVTVKNIECFFPSKVVITVSERAECAQICMAPERYLTVDSSGRMMKVYAQDPGMLKILGVGELTVYQDGIIESKDAVKYENMRAILAALDKAELLEQIQSIDVSEAYDLMLETAWGYRVDLGNADKLDSKMTNLKSIVEILQNDGKNGGTINMTVDGKYTYNPN